MTKLEFVEHDPDPYVVFACLVWRAWERHDGTPNTYIDKLFATIALKKART